MQRLTFCFQMSAGVTSSLTRPADDLAMHRPAPVIS
jgi:hypothetical protein